MNFRAAKNLISRNNIPKNSVVLEATTHGHTIDIEGETMGVWILTDKMIEENNVKEVTSSIWFKNGSEPTDDGLFSPVIFGETAKERSKNHGYINLRRRFFHPYVYEVLKKLYSQFDTIAMGQGAWYIDEETGAIEQITDPQDKRYNEDNTGLGWLIENFRKIQFKETESDQRKNRLKMIQNLNDDEIFITKWIVIPIFYRDFTVTGGKKSIPDINYWYNEIIMNVSSYDNEILSITKHMTLYRVQKTLCDIRKFGQSLIEKKKGAFQKTVLGKNVDYGGRGVISVPSLNGCETPNDCIVDVLHAGIPLAYCISMGYPFMIKWVTEFFEDMFRNKSVLPCYVKTKDGNNELQYLEIDDQTEVFTREFIDKKMNTFIKTYGAERFETIKVKTKDGRETELYFPGRYYGNEKGRTDLRANTIANRPLTWTDVFYLAAVETLSDKFCYITRYPLEDYFGTYPSQVAVLSTIKTAPVIINGKVYPHYPVINLNLPRSEIATQFIDTFSISNLYLDALGGDYDGDTVSAKILFSIEANEEAAAQVKDIKHYMTIQGKLVRVLGNETYLTFYNMTRRE